MQPAAKRAFKDRLYEQFARITRALGNARRLELLDLLAQGERTVEQLAAETALSVANASQHLQILRAAQLVEVRREGTYARHRLAGDKVLHAWLALRDLAESRYAEVERLVETYLSDRSGLEPVTAAELRRQLKAHAVVLLDVRPRLEFDAGHIPGARSIPISELASRLNELPRGKQVVAYCRGPYCVFADEAVELLQKHGLKARRLQEGLPEWMAMGNAVAVSPAGKTTAGRRAGAGFSGYRPGRLAGDERKPRQQRTEAAANFGGEP